MPPGFNRASLPSRQPREGRDAPLTDEQIASYLSDHFEVPFLKGKLQEMVEATKKKPEERKQLREWVVALEAMEGRLELAAGVPKQNILWIEESVYKEMDIRRKVLDAVLEALQKKGREARSAGGSAFIDLKTGKKKTEEIIREIEELVYRDPPDPLQRGGERNKLYYKNNPYLPKFNIIDDKVALINQAFHAIDRRDKSPEGIKAIKATEERLRNLKAALAVIQRMDPMGAALHWQRKTKGKSFLAGPAGKALGIAMGALALMGAINVLRKLFKGEKLGLPDALPVAYGVAALKLWGVKFSKDDSELNATVQTIGRIKYDEKFQMVVGKVTKAGAIEAAEEFASIMRSPEKREKKKELEKALKNEEISFDFLENFAGPDSALVRVLNKKNITRTELRIFLAKLHSVLTEEENLVAVIAAIDNPQIYSITSLDPPTKPSS